MPPKTSPATKGQTNLFSFFKKPKIDEDPSSVQSPSPQPVTPVVESPSPVVVRTLLPVTKEELESLGVDDCKVVSLISKERKRSPKVLFESDEEVWDGNDEEDEEFSAEEPDSSSSSSDDQLVDSDSSSSEDRRGKRGMRRARDAKVKVPKKKQKQDSLTTTPSKPPRPPAAKQSKVASESHLKSPTVFASTMSDDSPSRSPFSDGRVASSPDTPNSIQSIPKLILPEGVEGLGSHEHNTWDFLKPSHRRDKTGKPMSHPEHNPRTLFVPESFMRTQTPAMVQWWNFKSENMDTVLFFKVGKFYELFHMDADVGMTELDLIYMKGSKAHSGFPEIAYGKSASTLVSKGYRVARVEQTETPEMLKDRNDSKGGKKDKVVSREVCSVMSKGTRTYCHLDDLSLLESGSSVGQSSSILFGVKEIESAASDSADGAVPEYGISCIDTVLGTITLAQFQDDLLRSRLRTMVSRFSPSEVLLEYGCHSKETLGVFKLLTPSASIDFLRGGEMPVANDVMRDFSSGNYFSQTPPLLTAVFDGLVDNSSGLVVAALGATVWHLKRALIDFDVLSMGQFFAYIPPDHDSNNLLTGSSVTDSVLTSCDDSEQPSAADEEHMPVSMTLDAVALGNLEILQNNFDRSEKGSLWSFVNRCKTPFGMRLLKEWVCHPLFRPSDISKRSLAVNELLNSLVSRTKESRAYLSKVPDLERLLARVHSNGLKKRGHVEHPDSRAILYESQTYNARKIRDFADVLTGFELIRKAVSVFADFTVSSRLLSSIVKSKEEGGLFPATEMTALLTNFREIFDEKQAKKDGFIRPRPGVDSEFDQSKEDVSSIESELEQYLRDMKKKTGINDLKYWGSNKDRFQIEVPIGLVSKVPGEWTTKSQKKSHRRYWTPYIEKRLSDLMNAEERVTVTQGGTLRRIFERFDESRHIWSQALRCAANLDALMSLAEVSASPGFVWAEVIPSGGYGTELLIEGGRHPMLEFAFSQRGESDYIPNNLCLGGTITLQSGARSLIEQVPKLLLLSGPNMGGKSTLLRQTCLIAILAQLGCKVPATRCRLTPVDRIFTRVGASDRILAGMSTFFVELAETALVLKSATENSLCILDELGRGTATFDGTAIAHAVVEHLVSHLGCRALFATHYHSLVQDWEMDPRVQLGHMDCLVHSEKSHESEEDVTFLYRLCVGSSPKSYGINVARLAKLPVEVIQLARKCSLQLEVSKKSDSEVSTERAQLVAKFDRSKSFFEKLVSLTHSHSNVEEIAGLAREIWRRYLAV